MTSQFKPNRENLIRIFFFIAFAFFLAQAFLIARPFLPSVLVASVLALMFHPVHRWLRQYIKQPGLVALIMTVGIVLTCVLPFVVILWTLIHESSGLLPTAQNVLSQISQGNLALYADRVPASVLPYYERLSNFLNGVHFDLRGFILDNARGVAMRVSALGAFAARNAFVMIFKFMIMVLSLFFMVRDGEKLLAWIINVIPMERSHKHAVTKTAYETFWAVTIGVFLTAAAQGLTAMVGFMLAGIRMPVLLGMFTGVVSLLGVSSIVCIPVALFVLMENTAKGLFLLFWGAVLVGWLDNILKPIFIGSRARMPFVLVFFSILGGVKMYGPVGLILGPVVVACVLTFIRIYRETYNP
jgi:predicted PurR-regulated permease PerM